MTPPKTVLHLGQLRILNLILFFRAREHTIVAAKDSSWLDVEIGNKHNQLVIHDGEEKELKQEATAVSACYVPVCFKKKHNAHKAVWYTKATVHWSNFSIVVDSLSSYGWSLSQKRTWSMKSGQSSYQSQHMKLCPEHENETEI